MELRTSLLLTSNDNEVIFFLHRKQLCDISKQETTQSSRGRSTQWNGFEFCQVMKEVDLRGTDAESTQELDFNFPERASHQIEVQIAFWR